MTHEPLLEIENLSVDYSGPRWSKIHAVKDVSLMIHEGETVGLVGESGSGKSTIGSAVLGLAKPAQGTVRFRGQDITRASVSERRALSRELQVIFQDPFSSLNPSRTIAQTLAEPLLIRRGVRARDANQKVVEMLERVGFDESVARRYPAQMSGGQRQRIAIARALIVSPQLVICDEVVSALDLSIQAQVLNLLLTLQRDTNLGYLFISHDLSVVYHMCDRIAVLYRGSIVETGSADEVYNSPRHPYTKALLAAVPVADPVAQKQRRENRAHTRFASGGSADDDPTTHVGVIAQPPYSDGDIAGNDPDSTARAAASNGSGRIAGSTEPYESAR